MRKAGLALLAAGLIALLWLEVVHWTALELSHVRNGHHGHVY